MTRDEAGPTSWIGDAGMNLRCTFCDGEISALLEYSGVAYSEHRDCVGFECADSYCAAEWDIHGVVTTPGKQVVRPEQNESNRTLSGEERDE